MINDMLKEQCQNLQKIFQNIITVSLLDVKNQLSSKNVDAGLHSLQDILEKSISAKLQEDEFIASHLKSLEHSIMECNTFHEESLLIEKSNLENQVKILKEDCDKEVKLKRHEIEKLKKELLAKENILNESLHLSENFENVCKDLTAANEYTQRLENENNQLKSKLKSMVDNLRFTKLNAIIEKSHNDADRKGKEKEDQESVEDEKVERYIDLGKDLEEKKVLLENVDKNSSVDVVGHKKVSDEEINCLENTLNLSTLNNQVELLTDQVEELKSKKALTEDVLDLKDGKILSLQSTVDKMKIILLECKSKEHNVMLQLNDANVTIEKLKKVVSLLQKEKDNMRDKLEKTNLKMSFMQKEWQKVVTVENHTKEEIQKLRNDRKSILNKLKEKSMILSSKDTEHDKIKANLNEIKQRYVKVEKTLIKLTNNYDELEKARETLQVEKDNLKAQLYDHEETNELEVAQFLKQLYFLEDDLDVEEFSSSGRRWKVSTIAQKIILNYKNQLASLKSNISQMKKSLEVSTKEKLVLQKRLAEKEEYLGKFKAKLVMLEEINGQLKSNVSDHQSDTKSLQKALQDAVTSYTHVCSLFEKQESALQKEREVYNSEILNLQKRLKKKTSSKTVTQLEPSCYADSGVHLSEDLRYMLNDIKTHLSSTLNNMSSKWEKGYSQPPAVSYDAFDLKHSLNGERISKHYSLSNVEDTMVNSSIGSNTQKLNEYLKQHSHEMSDASFQSKASSVDMIDRTITSHISNSLRALSRSELNNTTDEISQTLLEFSDSSKLNGNSNSLSWRGNNIVRNEEDDAVRNLQEKLSRLHDMGTDLKSNNIELGEMMKSHSKKLRVLKKQTNKNMQ